MAFVDQQTRRRSGRTGVTALDEDRACPGYTLFTPQFGDGDAILIDLRGNVAHRWRLPHAPAFSGELMPDGTLFYGGRAPSDSGFNPFPLWGVIRGGAMAAADWDGNIVWEHRDAAHHHDARRTASGGAMYLGLGRVPDGVAERVKGGVPGSAAGGMWADEIVEVDVRGKRVWTWRAWEWLDPDADAILYNDPRAYWTHGNAVAPLGGGRALVSFRSPSRVCVVDKASGAIEWKFGAGTLAQQHDPSILPNGNALIFDNGTHRADTPFTYSRVIEVDPATDRIVWSYEDKPSLNFYSPILSSARRLPNGNTLITEGFFGRMFQATPDGQVVWEYISPYFHDSVFGESNAVFRANHYSAGYAPGL